MGGAEWDGGAPFDRALDVRPRVERLVAVDVRLVAEHRLVPPLAGERVEAVRLRRELVPQHRLQLLERRRLLLLRLLPLGGEQPLVDRRLPREALRRALELEPRGARRRVDREHLVLGERDRLRARVGRGAAQRAQSKGARLPWARPRLRRTCATISGVRRHESPGGATRSQKTTWMTEGARVGVRRGGLWALRWQSAVWAARPPAHLDHLGLLPLLGLALVDAQDVTAQLDEARRQRLARQDPHVVAAH